MHYSEDPGRQYHIGTTASEIGSYVILTGDPGRCEKIAEQFDDYEFVASNREYTTYTGHLDGQKISVCSTGIGGPSAAIALEELVKCGANTFIRVGTSGGMQLDIMGGDVVIASGAIRAEGTSKEYAPIEYPAVSDITVANALARAAGSDKIKARYHVGVVQSKDSFYGQHDPSVMPVSYELENKWQAWIRMGCLASEMETAALFIVGGFLRVRVGACFLVMGNQEREAKGLSNPIAHDTDLPIRTAVEAMRILIKEDRERSLA